MTGFVRTVVDCALKLPFDEALAAADGRAANPFESCLRAIALEVEGFAFHGTRAGLERDCRRYTELTIYGWRVLRYTWHDVMYRPEWVRWTIETLVAELDGREPGRPPTEVRRAVPA